MSIAKLVDGFFFGYIISVALFGIAIIQGWMYFRRNSDPLALRIFVSVLLLLDLSETICSTKVIHDYLIAHFGDIDLLTRLDMWVNILFLITVCIFTMVHIFFSRCIYIVCQTRALSALLLGICFVMFGCGVARSLIPSRNVTFSGGKPSILVYAFHGFSILSDLIITTALIIKLSTSSKELLGTRNINRLLTVFMLTRGLLIGAAQLGHLILQVISPENFFFWSGVHLIISKLYVLTTLVVLNSRRYLRRRGEEIATISLRLPEIDFGVASTSSTRSLGAPLETSPTRSELGASSSLHTASVGRKDSTV